ncbi:unnamed protein product, partial [Rotaria sp. Silwood2]
MQEKICSSDLRRLATLHLNLGNDHADLGRQNLALECYERSLEIELKILPPADLSIATIYNNIGTIHRDKCNFKEALEFYEKAYKICNDNGAFNYSTMRLAQNNIEHAKRKQAQSIKIRKVLDQLDELYNANINEQHGRRKAEKMCSKGWPMSMNDENYVANENSEEQTISKTSTSDPIIKSRLSTNEDKESNGQNNILCSSPSNIYKITPICGNKQVLWYWKSNTSLREKWEDEKWMKYTSIESEIIEEAYRNGDEQVELD